MEEGDSKGWIRRIMDALAVKRSKCTAKYDTRPYASDLAVDYRAQFDRDVELYKQPLKVGDMALSHGDSCVVTSIGGTLSDYGEEGPPCVLTFHEDSVSKQYSYESMSGSARLQRPPQTLAPPPCGTRSDTVDVASQPSVAMLINSLELRVAGFTLREVNLPALEAAARGGMRRYGAGLRPLQSMGCKRFSLSADNDNEFRS